MRTSSVSESQPTPVVKEETCCTHLPFAIAIIIMIGSAFLLLAAYRVFPSYPNPISALSTGGLAIGYCAAGIGGIVLIIAMKNNCTSSSEKPLDPVRKSDGKVMSASELTANETELRALETTVHAFDLRLTVALEQNDCKKLMPELSSVIEKFKNFYEKAKADINANGQARRINCEIESIGNKIAGIAWRMDQDNMPKELISPSCEAYKELAVHWQNRNSN